MSMMINSNYQANYLNQTRKDSKENKVASKANALQNAKESKVSSSPISKNNEAKLSKKAKEFLASLREKYGDYDFFVGNGADDLKGLSKSGAKEISVIFSNEEIERMASDENYANEKLQGVEGAVDMVKKIATENGFASLFGDEEGQNGTLSKITISFDDNGNMKMFAELEKTNDKQKERIEKAKDKKLDEKNPYTKKENQTVKRATVEANSMEELLQKIKDVDWDSIEASHSGERFNFMA